MLIMLKIKFLKHQSVKKPGFIRVKSCKPINIQSNTYCEKLCNTASKAVTLVTTFHHLCDEIRLTGKAKHTKKKLAAEEEK